MTQTSLQPMTALQSSMALASLRAPRSGVYIVQDVCDIQHSLDVNRLREAWKTVEARHEALRSAVRFSSTFEPELEIFDKAPDVDWSIEDWASIRPHEYESALQRVLDAQYARGFSFATGGATLPYRFTLIRKRDDLWALIWTCHHVILDGRSLLNIWREWFEVYDGIAQVERKAPPVNRIPEKKDDEEYWRAILNEVDPEAGRLIDRAASPFLEELDQNSGREIRLLNASDTESLKIVANEAGVGLSTLVSAAWAILLARHGGSRKDVLFGVSSAGRPSGNQEIGFYIQTALLKVEVEPQQALPTFLKQVREASLLARRHEHTPLTEAMEWAGISSDNSIFDSLIAYDHLTVNDFARSFGGQWADGQRSLRRCQRTDLPFTLAAYGGRRLQLEVICARDRYTKAFSDSVADQIAAILRGFVSHRDAPTGMLPLLPESQQSWLIDQGSGGALDIPSGRSAIDVFEERVRTQPAAPAIDDYGKAISYEELNARANRLAWALRNKGIGPDDLVVVLMPRGATAVMSTLAVVKSGAAALPVDPAQPLERLQAMLGSVKARFTLSLEEPIDTAGFPDTNPPKATEPDHAAYAIFTSGSTGVPKAVVVPHKALANHSLAVAPVYDLEPSDRRLQFASPGADVFIAEVFTYLCAGACLVCCLDPGPPSFEQFTRALVEHRISITGMPASWWKEWMRSFAANGGKLPSTLRAMICGMERLDASALDQWRELAQGRVRLFNAYGPAETSPTSLIYEFGSSAWEGDQWAPVGKPIANTSAHILLGNSLAPMGVPGELYLGGNNLARGYANAAEETRKRFVPNPLEPGSLLYRTGDLAFRLPDGNLVFLGRIDQQMKVRGYRIEPEEIEGVLQRHSAIREAAVVVNEQDELVAYYCDVEGGGLSLQGLRAHCRQFLPSAIIPAIFARVEVMPRAPGGKIHRQTLLMMASERLSPTTVFRAPASKVEIEMAGLWSSILNVSPIGLDDNFFDLGGTSLASTRLIAAIATNFGVDLTLPSLLRNPVLSDLAQLCESSSASIPAPKKEDGDSLIALQPNGTMTPLIAICCTNEDLAAFRQLASHLPPHQPIFLLHCPAKWQGPLATLESIAQRVGRVLASEWNEGQYILAGFCFAGVVAYDAANRLHTDAPGKAPKSLVMFDVFRPGMPAALRAPSAYLRILRAISLREIGSQVRFAISLFRRRLQASADARALNQSSGAQVDKAAPATTATMLEWLERSAAMYTAGPSNVPCLQFISRDIEMSTRVLDDPRLAWKDLCRGGFTVREVPGAHTTLFSMEHLSALSEELMNALQDKNRNSRAAASGLA